MQKIIFILKMSRTKYVGGKEASSLLGVHQRTLYQWETKKLIDSLIKLNNNCEKEIKSAYASGYAKSDAAKYSWRRRSTKSSHAKRWNNDDRKSCRRKNIGRSLPQCICALW